MSGVHSDSVRPCLFATLRLQQSLVFMRLRVSLWDACGFVCWGCCNKMRKDCRGSIHPGNVKSCQILILPCFPLYCKSGSPLRGPTWSRWVKFWYQNEAKEKKQTVDFYSPIRSILFPWRIRSLPHASSFRFIVSSSLPQKITNLTTQLWDTCRLSNLSKIKNFVLNPQSLAHNVVSHAHASCMTWDLAFTGFSVWSSFQLANSYIQLSTLAKMAWKHYHTRLWSMSDYSLGHIANVSTYGVKQKQQTNKKTIPRGLRLSPTAKGRGISLKATAYHICSRFSDIVSANHVSYAFSAPARDRVSSCQVCKLIFVQQDRVSLLRHCLFSQITFICKLSSCYLIVFLHHLILLFIPQLHIRHLMAFANHVAMISFIFCFVVNFHPNVGVWHFWQRWLAIPVVSLLLCF